MLQLSRKVGESIKIVHNGEVLLIHITGKKSNNEFVLGFEGSRSFDVVRDNAKKKEASGNL